DIAAGSCRRVILPGERSATGQCVNASSLTFVFGLGVEVACGMALMQLFARLAKGTVDDATAFHSRALGNFFGPALNVLITACIQELGGVIHVAKHHVAEPWPDGDIGDA